MSESYLSPAAAAKIEGYVQRGLATAIAIVTPPRFLTIRRLNDNTGAFEAVMASTFFVRIQNRQALEITEESVENQQIRGTMKRTLPVPVTTRLKPGDRFTIPEIGPATIATVYPDKFGIETAEWVLEEGAS